MKVLNVTYYEILRYIRDWKAITILLLAPLITIIITGNATLKIDENTRTEKTAVVYYNADKGQLSNGFDSLLQTVDIKNSFDITKVSSYNDGYKKVQSGKVEAFIFIPENFSDDLKKGNKLNIQVFSGKEMSAAKLLVEGFTNKMNTSAALNGADSTLATVNGEVFQQTAITMKGKAPSGLDKWTYLNITLFLFYGAILGCISAINNIKRKTILRINTAPMGRFTSVTGIFLGNTIVSFVCTVIIIIISKYLIGSNWDGNILIILLSFLLFSAISNAFGIIFGYISKNAAVGILIIFCGNIYFSNAAISANVDGTVPLPIWMKATSPHYYAYNTVIDDIFNGSVSKAVNSLLMLALMAAITIGAMLLAGGRRKTI